MVLVGALASERSVRYGWHPDLPDIRDLKLTAVNPLQAVPHEFALPGQFMPVVRDSGQLGADAAVAVGGAMEFLLAREVASDVELIQDCLVECTSLHEAMKEARVKVYKRLTADSIKQAIFGYGPVVFGFSAYESFESDDVRSSGIVPLPSRSENSLGGLATWAWGWKIINLVPYICCRGHWSDQWGDQGNFYLPEAYVRNPDLAADFWSLSVTV